MLLFSRVEDVRLPKDACITIGNFDGVHLGHQALIAAAQKVAREKDLDFLLMTFWPHPRLVLANNAGHRPLTTRARRLELFGQLGVERAMELEFTPTLAQLSPEEFVKNYLAPLKMRQLVIGHDFSLGQGRAGNADLLRRLGEKYGFNVAQIPAMEIDGQPVSSTRLRKCLEHGNVGEAARLLGRNYSICGHVGHGFGRGSGLGFPTANLEDQKTLVPGDGVYATFARCAGQVFRAVTNIGKNPTFEAKNRSIESFLLNTELNLYGKNLELEFVARLRGEKRFASPRELSAQIARDAEAAQNMLKTAAGHD